MKKEQNNNVKLLLANKPKIIFKLLISILVLILAILVVIILTYHKSGTGFIIVNSGNYTGTGYAYPDVFNITPDDFALDSSQILNISVNVSKPNGYVYRVGYFYNARINNWVPFTFPQATVGSSNWIPGDASTLLSLNMSNLGLLGGNLSYIVTYACNRTSSSSNWVCGCESSLPGAQCNEWMIQGYRVSGLLNNSASNTTLKSCVVNNDCLAGQNCSAEGVCVGNVVIQINIIPITDCTTINSPGYYSLNQSLTTTGTCITINANNVVLDLNGFNIIGSNIVESYGIYANSVSGLTIENGTIKNFNKNSEKASGVFLSNTINSTILNLLTSNNWHGIYLALSSNNNFYNLTSYSNKMHGIYLDSGSNNNNFYNTTSFSNDDSGIVLYANSNNNFYNTTAYSNKGHGIYLYISSNNKFYSTTSYSNKDYGLSLALGSNNNRFFNIITNSNTWFGIGLLSSSSNNTFSGTSQAQNNTNKDVYLNSDTSNNSGSLNCITITGGNIHGNNIVCHS